MGLSAKLWSYIKGLRPIRKYATDAKGNEIKFPLKTNIHRFSFHDGSKPNHKHTVQPCAHPTHPDGLTNNERVRHLRARAMRIPYADYEMLYPR